MKKNISTLRSGVISFRVIANDVRLYLVGFSGGSLFFHNKAVFCWDDAQLLLIEASSFTVQYMLSSHLPVRVAALAPEILSFTKPSTLQETASVSSAWKKMRNKKDTEGPFF